MTELSFWEQAAVIGLCAAMTIAARALPFLCFGPGRDVPPCVRYLGRTLPAAVFALLLVYCLRDVPFVPAERSAAELLGAAATAALHLWRRNMMLSMAGGTVCYMALLRFFS